MSADDALAATTSGLQLNRLASKYELHSQGAEAVSAAAAVDPAGFLLHSDALLVCLQRVWEGSLQARPVIVKQRFSKQYRHPVLDAKLTVSRLKQVREWLGI
jgi:tRNA A-37 threonylcarbamoyl transferase component Bud32